MKHLCCYVSKECWHNSTPQRIEELLAQAKAKQAAEEKERVKHLPPFDMQEWYRRTKQNS
jgi:hypothetical protein